MSAPPFDLSATPAQRARRNAWILHLARVLLPQDLTAEDRIAILAILQAREIAQFPRAQWEEISRQIGYAMGAACSGAADARASTSLAMVTPAGHG